MTKPSRSDTLYSFAPRRLLELNTRIAGLQRSLDEAVAERRLVEEVIAAIEDQAPKTVANAHSAASVGAPVNGTEVKETLTSENQLDSATSSLSPGESDVAFPSGVKGTAGGAESSVDGESNLVESVIDSRLESDSDVESLTIKQMVLKVLAASPRGLSNGEVADGIQARFKRPILRSSLSPKLHSLASEGAIERVDKLWFTPAP